MASWKDGAAYAPTERPDGFATPSTEPLDAAEPWRAATPGPLAPPRSISAPDAQPLDQVARGERPGRDPRESFAVASSLLTAEPIARKRDPREPFVTSGSLTATASDQPPPPTGQPLPLPLPPPGVPEPAPGTTGPWGPPAVVDRFQPPTPRRVDRTTAQLTYLASGLSLVGFLMGATAPFMMIVAGALGQRTQGLAAQAGRWSLGGGVGILAIQMLTGRLGAPSSLGTLACLVLAVVFAVAAFRSQR